MLIGSAKLCNLHRGNQMYLLPLVKLTAVRFRANLTLVYGAFVQVNVTKTSQSFRSAILLYIGEELLAADA